MAKLFGEIAEDPIEPELPNDTTYIKEQSTSLQVFPNPANDILFIEAEVEIEEVVVYDVFGRQQKLSAISGQQSVIDVSELNAGIYIIKINTKEGNIVKQFIKQ